MTMTKKKTASKSREEIALEEIEAARTVLAEAYDTINDAEAAVDEAVDSVHEIEAGWSSGDDSKTALEYAVATAEVVKAKSLLRAAEAAKARAERAVRSTDITLAEIVARFVRESHGGPEVTATFLTAEEDKPGLTVSQREATMRGRDGNLSGEVTVTYVRSKMHRELRGRDIEEAALVAGMNLTANTIITTPAAKAGEDMEMDRLTVLVRNAHEEVPTMTEPGEMYASRFAQSLASALVSEVCGSASLAAGGTYEGRTALAKAENFNISSTDDGEGYRLTTVETQLSFRRKSATFGSDFAETAAYARSLPAALKDMLPTYEGTFTPGLGVCIEAGITRGDSDTFSPYATVRAAFKSRTA